MTVIRSNSISGINSITAQSASLNFYDTSGNALSIGASVTGDITGNVTSSGISSFSGELNVGAGKSIRLYGATSGYTEIVAAAGSASTTFTLPANGGSASQYLQTDGSGGLSWQTIVSSGTILNTWTATDTVGRTTTSETFGAYSNTASVTLTPASASSKFLVTVTTTMSCNDGNDGWIITLFRDSTNLATTANQGFFQGNSVPNVSGTTFPVTIVHLDSPNTTSEIVYQPQFRTIDYDNDGGTARMGYTANGSAGGPATVITVLEIGG